jgi:hydrogenase/urease accessory protein HupE
MGELILELFGFMRERKKYWLLPIIFVMLMLGGLIVLTQGSAMAPFIYTLF